MKKKHNSDSLTELVSGYVRVIHKMLVITINKVYRI